ncbi:MAG: serine protein kinase RIO [Pyrodictiaceae archaeon]
MRKLRLDRFAGVVSAGKEARVYRAIGRDGSEFAVKIYLTVTAEFRKSIQKYLIGDPRFQNVDTSNAKKLFFAWARKEYRNLKRMYDVGARVPRPILVYQNIVVMEFIGREGKRAPLLHEIYGELSREDALEVYRQVIESYRRAYCCARLVHADLSEYNIMYLDGKTYIIDVAQAVLVDHPNSGDFLWNDASNLYRFFTKKLGLDIGGVEDVVREMTRCREIECVKDKRE